MSILLIGCGYWGQNWAKTLYRLGELGGICEPSPSLQASLAERFPEAPLFDNLAQALLQPNIEAVVVATPAPTHLQVTQQCLLSGKPALVEKPLALTASEASMLVSLAEEQNLPLAVGHLLMYHPALLKLKSLIQAGELGDVLAVQCTRVNLGKVRNEENCWWSLAPHDLSILSFLLEVPFTPVATSKMNLLGRSDIEDTVYAQFETSTGRKGSIYVSWLHPEKRHETIVIGTEKIAVFEDTQPPEKKLLLMDYGMERVGDSVQGIQREGMTYIPYEMPDELLALEAKGFLSAVRNGTPLVNSGRSGLQVVRMLEEVQKHLDAQSVGHTFPSLTYT